MPYTKEQVFDALYPTLKQYTDTKEEALDMIQKLYSVLLKARREVNASQFHSGAKKPLDKYDEGRLITQEFYNNKFHKGMYNGILPYGIAEVMEHDLENEQFESPNKLFFNTPMSGLGLKKRGRGRPHKIHKKNLTKGEMVDILHEHGLKGNMSMTKAELEKLFRANVKGGNILTSGIFKEFGDFGSKLIDEYPKAGLKYAIEHPDQVAKLIAKLF